MCAPASIPEGDRVGLVWLPGFAAGYSAKDRKGFLSTATLSRGEEQNSSIEAAYRAGLEQAILPGDSCQIPLIWWLLKSLSFWCVFGIPEHASTVSAHKVFLCFRCSSRAKIFITCMYQVHLPNRAVTCEAHAGGHHRGGASLCLHFSQRAVAICF